LKRNGIKMNKKGGFYDVTGPFYIFAILTVII